MDPISAHDMLQALVAGARRSDVETQFDWNSQGPSAYWVAKAQFMSRVVASVNSGSDAGYMSGSLRTDTPAEELIASKGWSIHGDWRVYGDRYVIASHHNGEIVLFSHDGGSGDLTIDVFSPRGHEDAHGMLDRLIARCQPVEMATDDLVEVRFWANTSMGPMSFRRQLQAPTWADVAGNYPTGLRTALSNVHAWSAPPAGGRLMLAHGPAGTGKTTAVRSLARAWSSWCDVDVVVDPDEFFGHAAYMMSVLLGGGDDTRHRMIVIEDCDELLTVDAKQRSGQQVAKLLNAADGLIGQGLKILLYLTTNEQVENFHEAITRPGRCLQNMLFDRFDVEDADAWRANHDVPVTGVQASLADLFSEQRLATREKASRVAKRLRSAE